MAQSRFEALEALLALMHHDIATSRSNPQLLLVICYDVYSHHTRRYVFLVHSHLEQPPFFLPVSFVSLFTTVVAATFCLVAKRQSADVVDNTLDASLASCHLARRARVARWHIQAGVLSKEVARSQKHCHGLGRHDGVVLGGREVRQAESMPQDLR
jgi:hypothetical protein